LISSFSSLRFLCVLGGFAGKSLFPAKSPRTQSKKSTLSRNLGSIEENRFIVMGESNKNRLLVVSYTERPPATRLISARKATRSELKNYEEEN